MIFILYATAALYLFLPLQFALSPADTIDLALVRVYVLLLFFITLTYSLFHKKIFIPRGWIISFLTLFFLWMFFSLFFSPVITWTIRKIIFFLTLLPLFYMLITVFLSHKNAVLFIYKATVCGAVLACIVGLTQFFLQFIFPLNTLLALWANLTPFFLGGTFSSSVIMHNSWLVNVGGHDIMRSIGFFPDPHVFSFYLGIIAPLALGIFFTTKKNIWLWAFGIILFTDLLTFSRGGYVGLCGGVFIGIVLLWPHIHTHARHFLLLLFISCIVIIFIPHNPITSRFLSSFDTTDTSNTHRIELWTRAVEEIVQRPLIGTGLGAYAHTIDPRATYRTPIYVHNLFLDIAVELGLIGLTFFIGVLSTTLITLYKNRHHFLALFAIISISIFVFHSLFDTALFSVHILPLLFLLFALGAYYENTSSTQ